MGTIEFENEKSALVHTGDVTQPIARLYRMKDGWHAKLAHLHTGKAWFGPFESPEEALTEIA
ncbi:hypothetical protein ITJ64_10270 [Herbiconiux sp. VKM Ac-1786]|jgi:hypothetical protein|uniref:hypothetical protein n=1 Tax=Herbiconiux sp. VKM Ac-1786 TaxID=2783824 RepID=UPI00188D1A57|nr:hypothetical protein [Herbiconiux sp. VKM Ac-1786]MBF4572901.1 hypothetical protein [Herbiconiux sp. VKM Ac-1786]